jgi:site-specific DNA-methyltransferase (adenine-specific)
MTTTWLVGPALDVVGQLPDSSVDLVATSPPFWKLRDYGDGLPGQWGQEPTPAAFLDHLLELAVELRRVLTPTGSITPELPGQLALEALL